MPEAASAAPLLTAHLFPTLDAHLIDLLRSLTPNEWELQTIAPKWKVKDVAAHLVDTQLRRLSMGRDGYFPSPPPVINSDRDLVDFINRLNADGVAVYRRLSPPVLIEWMEQSSREAARYYASLDPLAPASFAVSWAGESSSANWFDTAREFTERWHHQQQIRLAVGRGLDTIMTPQLYHPVLDCCLRALPFHYRVLRAPSGTSVRIRVDGDCGGEWHLQRRDDTWMLRAEIASDPAAIVAIPQEIAWRIFTKGIARDEARTRVRMEGDRALGDHVLSMLAIIASYS